MVPLACLKRALLNGLMPSDSRTAPGIHDNSAPVSTRTDLTSRRSPVRVFSISMSTRKVLISSATLPPRWLPSSTVSTRVVSIPSERNPLDLHPIIARPQRDRFLSPQRQLQPLQMLEARPICRTATPSGGSHPVVPLAGESFGQQDPAADREAPKRDDLLTPTAVDRQRRGPARTVVFHQRDVERLTSAEAAQPQSQLVRRGYRFLPRQDSCLDHERRRIIDRTPAARVYRQLVVKDRLARRGRDCDAE